MTLKTCQDSNSVVLVTNEIGRKTGEVFVSLDSEERVKMATTLHRMHFVSWN